MKELLLLLASWALFGRSGGGGNSGNVTVNIGEREHTGNNDYSEPSQPMDLVSNKYVSSRDDRITDQVIKAAAVGQTVQAPAVTIANGLASSLVAPDTNKVGSMVGGVAKSMTVNRALSKTDTYPAVVENIEVDLPVSNVQDNSPPLIQAPSSGLQDIQASSSSGLQDTQKPSFNTQTIHPRVNYATGEYVGTWHGWSADGGNDDIMVDLGKAAFTCNLLSTQVYWNKTHGWSSSRTDLFVAQTYVNGKPVYSDYTDNANVKVAAGDKLSVAITVKTVPVLSETVFRVELVTDCGNLDFDFGADTVLPTSQTADPSNSPVPEVIDSMPPLPGSTGGSSGGGKWIALSDGDGIIKGAIYDEGTSFQYYAGADYGWKPRHSGPGWLNGTLPVVKSVQGNTHGATLINQMTNGQFTQVVFHPYTGVETGTVETGTVEPETVEPETVEPEVVSSEEQWLSQQRAYCDSAEAQLKDTTYFAKQNQDQIDNHIMTLDGIRQNPASINRTASDVEDDPYMIRHSAMLEDFIRQQSAWDAEIVRLTEIRDGACGNLTSQTGSPAGESKLLRTAYASKGEYVGTWSGWKADGGNDDIIFDLDTAPYPSVIYNTQVYWNQTHGWSSSRTDLFVAQTYVNGKPVYSDYTDNANVKVAAGDKLSVAISGRNLGRQTGIKFDIIINTSMGAIQGTAVN